MRKTFRSNNTNTNNIYNGVFTTKVPLTVGTIVKLNKQDPTSVLLFSSDPTITNIKQYQNTTFIDLIATNNYIYILGADNTRYFILQQSLEDPSLTSQIILGNFQEPLSLQGNITIHNDNIIVLLYHNGWFTITGNRHSLATKNGIILNISIQDTKITGFRNIPLTENFLLFGGLEEKNREEFLYLLDNNKLHRFNPTTSSSWIKTIDPGVISACTAANLLLLLHNNGIQAIDTTNGNILWNITIDKLIVGEMKSLIAKCCVAYGSKLYITILNNNDIIVVQGNIDINGFNVISQNIFTLAKTPILCCITTLNTDKYIIWTDVDIRLYTTDNQLLSTTSLSNLSLDRTYRLLPRHISFTGTVKLPIIINGIDSIFINGIESFTGIINTQKSLEPYAGLFILQDNFPQRAGVVTDIVDDNKVYVTFTGNVVNIFQNLLLHRTYVIDINGNLHLSDYNVSEKVELFLSVGNNSNIVSIIYNNL